MSPNVNQTRATTMFGESQRDSLGGSSPQFSCAESQSRHCAANNSEHRKEADMKTKYTILYERLSRDDGEDGVSNSIQNQRQFLEDYAERNNLMPFRHIQDDGWSGTRWDRPGWSELMSEVDAGNVSAIVVKNLDRMGRDYLRVGLYMEQFRDSGIRLIAISDGIDSDRGEDDFTPFRAILAEWYARDTSKKIRAIFNSRMAAGYHCSGSIPYGYLQDPNDRQNWIVDDAAAAVIRRIYQLVIDGKGVYQIADILAADKVLIPSAHLANIGVNPKHNSYPDPYNWRGGVVGTIVARREYMGIKILKKTYTDSYKQKKRKATPEDEQHVFEGAIPQIIDEEMWENAQRLRRTVRRPAKDGRPPSPLTGILYCADCGKKLTHMRNFDYDKNRGRDEYVCGNYRQGTKNCTMHYIRTSVVEKLILDAIRKVSKFAKLNEPEFVERVRERANVQQETEIQESKKRLNRAMRRIKELDTLITKLYETYALGKLPEAHFDRMIAEYSAEQTELQQMVSTLQTDIDGYAADAVRADSFIGIVAKYTEFETLTVPMLNEFVEKVIVHEGDKSSGERVQKVEVHFNFIGNFEIADEPVVLTAEESEAERVHKEKRAKARERQRLWRARKAAEKAAQEDKKKAA